MNLFIRHKEGIWINFIHSIDELKSFIDVYIPGRSIVIGDISQFNKPMLQALLKFIEENPKVDCYTSSDLTDPILLSRFTHIIKDRLNIQQQYSMEEFQNSNKDYVSIETYLSTLSSQCKLRAYKSSNNILKLLEVL